MRRIPTPLTRTIETLSRQIEFVKICTHSQKLRRHTNRSRAAGHNDKDKDKSRILKLMDMTSAQKNIMDAFNYKYLGINNYLKSIELIRCSTEFNIWVVHWYRFNFILRKMGCKVKIFGTIQSLNKSQNIYASPI